MVAQLAIAMKDEASEGGASRVLTALFERSIHPESRGRLLLLAASCIDSVDLPPSQVKALTRQTLDCILDPATSKSMREALQSWIQMGVRRWRDLVAAEFRARADDLVASENLHTRGVGYYLGASHARGKGLAPTPLDYVFWGAWVHENAAAWRHGLERDAPLDPAILHLAVKTDLMGIGPTLMRPRGFEQLVLPVRNPVIGDFEGSFLMWAGTTMRTAMASDPQAHGFCRELGEYLLTQSRQPPWTKPVAWIDAVPDGYGGVRLPAAVAETITEPVYLAVAVLTAIEVESRAASASEGTAVHSLLRYRETAPGWLNAVVAYLSFRVGEVWAPLPPLPVREDYQHLFRQWARREVDFTYPKKDDEATA
jgi:hypothetical protein